MENDANKKRQKMKNSDIYTIVKNGISYLPMIGMLMLVASLPFQYGWVQRTALYILGISYPIDYILNHRWQGWHWTQDKWVYAVMILFFLQTPLWQLFDLTPPTRYFCGQLEMRTAFIGVGIVGLAGWNKQQDICHYAAYVILLTAIGIVAYIGILEWTGTTIPNWEHRNRYLYNAISHRYVGAHMRVDFYQNMAIIFGLYLLHMTKSKWQMWAILTGILVLVVRLLFTDGRSGMIAMLLIVGIAIVFYLCKYASKWGIIASVLFLVLLGGTAIYQNDRMSHAVLHSEPRIAIWDYTLRQIEKHPLTGYGLSTASHEFVCNAQDDESMQHYLHSVANNPLLDGQRESMAVVNPHNLYLQLMLECGFMAPLLFILILALAVACCDKHKRLYMALTAFTILWQAVFDSFSPHFPPMMVCMSLWLMMLPEIRKNEKETITTQQNKL